MFNTRVAGRLRHFSWHQTRSGCKNSVSPGGGGLTAIQRSGYVRGAVSATGDNCIVFINFILQERFGLTSQDIFLYDMKVEKTEWFKCGHICMYKYHDGKNVMCGDLYKLQIKYCLERSVFIPTQTAKLSVNNIEDRLKVEHQLWSTNIAVLF